ncbi:MAG: M16 family metallopeptidase [Desulfobacterales bacterium]
MKSKIFFRYKNLLIILFLAVAAPIALQAAPSFAEKTNKTQNKAPSYTAADQNRCWPHEKSDFTPDPEVIFDSLENGLRYVIMKNQKPEDRVRMHMVVDAGSFHETEDQRGIAHFLEHMLFNGTSNFPPGELVKYFQRIGMAFGPDVNGSTGFYQTVYDLDLPAGDKESLEEAMLVFHDFAAEALLKQQEVVKERSVILSEKQTRDSPGYRTFKKTLKFELPEARISARMPIGIEPVIRNTGRELLKEFYDTWYRPERLTLVMVGDFEPETAKDLLAARFADLEARADQMPAPKFGPVKHKGIKPFYHHEPEAGNSRVAIETVEKQTMPADSSRYQEKRLLSQMANSIVGHRLNAMLEESDPPFTDAWIRSGHYLRFVKSSEIAADCDPEDWQKAFSAIEQVLRKALEHGFTESEVRRVQKEYNTRLEQAAKKAGTRRSSDIARDIIKKLSDNRVYQSPGQRLELLQPAVNSATPGSLHEAFKQEWTAGHRLLLVTGNADLSEADDSPEEAIRKVYEQSRRQPVKKPKKGAKVEFPYLLPPAGEGKIKKRQHIEDLGITRVVFDNGVTLLVKKTDFKDDQVLTAVSFGGGESAEPSENPALAEMTREVINLSGLGRLTREALKQALAGKNTSVRLEVEEDKFVFSADSVPEETRLMFELLYAHIKDPAFRVSARSRAIKRFKQRYESLSRSVQGAMELEGMRFFAGGDSRFGLPPIKAVENTELEDIRDWIKPALENAPLEIAVVGDINEEQVIREAGRFFGSLAQRNETLQPSDNSSPVFPKGKELNLSVPTRISKALLVTAYPTTDIWDIEKTRRLSILSRIFSDRMRIKIREEMGAAYSRTAFNKPGRAYPDYGILAGYIITDPEKITPVEEALKEIAADLHKNGAGEDELARALKPTLTGIREQLKTNEYWLDTVLKGAARHPVQLEWSRSIKDDYGQITVKDVNRMAQKYLKNKVSATIRIRPESAEQANVKENRKDNDNRNN